MNGLGYAVILAGGIGFAFYIVGTTEWNSGDFAESDCHP
jgi:hypothetical protein